MDDAQQSLNQISKFFFSKVDPILRLLLATIERYRVLGGEDGNEHGNNDKDNLDFEENSVSLLKSQIKLLDALLGELNYLMPSTDDGAANYDFLSMSLGSIATYIYLPLEAILGYRHEESIPLSRKSYLWQCQERSANIVVFMLHHCLEGSVDSERNVGFLILCTANISTARKELLSFSGANIRLDKGEEHSKALLRCSQVLIDQISREQILSSLEGQLMPRLALESISILLPSSDYHRQDTKTVSEALKTFGALVKAVPDKQEWRKVFPGCVQGMLRRILQELRGTRESSLIISECVQQLEQLLIVTMKPSVDKASIDAIEQLRQLAINESNLQGPARNEDDAFLKECNNRLPAVFNVIIKMMQVSKSPKTRSSAASLCKTLLMDCWSIWNIISRESIFVNAFQCCIILCDDENESVKDTASRGLDCFKASTRWPDFSDTLVSTVLACITELPFFMKTLRLAELHSKLKLAKGCLDLCVVGSSLGVSPLAIAMDTPDEVFAIRSHLSGIFDVDFESLQERSRIELALSKNLKAAQVVKFRYISGSTIILAKELVRSLGRALGHKRAFIFIDTCIYDLHNSYSDSTLVSQVSWLHEWIGVITLLEEILVGLTTSHLAQKGGLDRKNKKRLKLLSSNLFPLITRSPIWSLSTIQRSDENEAQQAGQLKPDTLSFDCQISAKTLKGNAFLILSLLRFIRLLIHLLGKDTSHFLPILLFPLFEKASKQNHYQVRAGAFDVIEEIRIVCSWETLEDLVCHNFDFLLQSLQNEMRQIRSSGRHGNLATIAKYILESIQGDSRLPSVATLHRTDHVIRNIDLTVKIGVDITSSFDRHFLRSELLESVQSLLDIIEFYEETLRYILRSFGWDSEEIEFYAPPCEAPDQPWLAIMQPFQKGSLYSVNTDEEFLEVTEKEKTDSIDITQGELNYLNLVLSRCSFFSSHPSLLVQVSSCQVQKLAFLILGHVSKNFTAEDGEDMLENPSNAIFRQISESWPSISSRVESLSKKINTLQNIHVLKSYIPSELAISDGSSSIIFLARLLELIGVMSFVSGSFMWSRIQGDVWSTCSSLLGSFLEKKSKTASIVEIHSPILTGNERLLLSLFNFFTGVFNQRELGLKAAPLISSIGAMLIPFIADKAPIGEKAMKTLKSMIIIDNDALWRPLFATSGQGQPSYPFIRVNSSQAITMSGQPLCLLQSRAQELLDFSNSLPEQAAGIDY